MTEPQRSGCPIASTLDIIGDRWTLVIVRDLINGKSKFSDFLDSPEHITTSVLTVRLNMLEENGIVTKQPYQLRPKRFEYALTKKGAHLAPILQAMCIWGNKFIKDSWVAPDSFMNFDPNKISE